MGATQMYPLTPGERAAVREALDDGPLDRLLLGFLATRDWVTKRGLQDAVDPAVAPRVPHWLASATTRGLLSREEGAAGQLRWRIADLGRARRNQLAHQALTESLDASTKRWRHRMLGRARHGRQSAQKPDPHP